MYQSWQSKQYARCKGEKAQRNEPGDVRAHQDNFNHSAVEQHIRVHTLMPIGKALQHGVTALGVETISKIIAAHRHRRLQHRPPRRQTQCPRAPPAPAWRCLRCRWPDCSKNPEAATRAAFTNLKGGLPPGPLQLAPHQALSGFC